MFTYTATARARGLKGLGVALLCLALGAFFLLFWWTIVLAIVGTIFSLVGLFVLGVSLIWLALGGRWRIAIEHGEAIWEAPLVSEGSFRYRLTEIDRIERRVREKRRKDGTTKVKVRYVLHGPGGKAHDLSPQSGVDVEAFVAALETQGIAVQETRRS